MKADESGRILVVDDQRTIAEMTAGLLRNLGHEVRVALDGEAALDQVRGGRFDLVLCDIMMPGMDGYELCRRLGAPPPPPPPAVGLRTPLRSPAQSPDG